ncbi:hypothetical protein NKI61_20295 [Mesorhizobium sp. M0514]|uniref:hypothetical protein n=1 Tax=Mesorhizobium sp. M0514 TaxID=2956955 RepID=UPI003338ECA5
MVADDDKAKLADLQGKKKELVKLKYVPIVWDDEPKKRGAQLKEFIREGVRICARDLIALRGVGLITAFFNLKNQFLGWTADELATWCGMKPRSIEESFGRLYKLGLAYPDHLMTRNPQGKLITVMHRVRASFPTDYEGPRLIVSQRAKPPLQSAAGLVSENVESVAGARAPRSSVTDPLRDKRVKGKAPKESYEKKRQASTSADLLSDETRQLVESHPITDDAIDEVISNPECEPQDDRHALYYLRKGLAKKAGVEKGSKEWGAFCAAVDEVRRKHVEEVEAQRDVEPISVAEIAARVEARFEEPRFDFIRQAPFFDEAQLCVHVSAEIKAVWTGVCWKWEDANPHARRRPYGFEDLKGDDLETAKRLTEIVLAKNLHHIIKA